MSSYNQVCRKSDVQRGRIVKSRCHVMVAHDLRSDKDYVLLGAAEMSVDLCKLDNISGRRCGEPLDDHVCVYGF